MRSHILRAEECQALRPLSSATGLGHRRLARRRHSREDLRTRTQRVDGATAYGHTTPKRPTPV